MFPFTDKIYHQIIRQQLVKYFVKNRISFYFLKLFIYFAKHIFFTVIFLLNRFKLICKRI